MYEKAMTTGRDTRESHAFVKEGKTAAVNANKLNWIDKRNVLGKSSSTQPMSLENLFNIRPAGFVSKNNTGACKAHLTILSWRSTEDPRQTRKKRYARMVAKSTPAEKSPA